MIFRLLIVTFSLLFCQPVEAAVSFPIAETAPVTAEAQPLNYNETNKMLDKLVAKLQKNKVEREETDNLLAMLGTLQIQAAKDQKNDTAELQNITKKINALTNNLQEGETEVPAIAKERAKYEAEAGKFKYQLAQNALVLAKIEEINTLILKNRNQELINDILTKQSSIFQPDQFVKALVSFWTFIRELLASPLSWYQKLSSEQQKLAHQQFGILGLVLGIASVLAVFLASFIKKHFGYDLENHAPSYMLKFKAAIWIFIARGLLPAAIIAAFRLWLNAFELMNESEFSVLLKSAAAYLFYFMILRAAILTLFAPKMPEWRLFNIDPTKVKTASRTLIFASAVIMAVSFVQNLAYAMNYGPDIIYSLQILANGIKAFIVAWAALKLMYNVNRISDEDFANGNIQKLSTSAQAALLIVVLMAAGFTASLFGYIRLSSFIIDRFIVSATVVGGLYVLNNLLQMIYHLAVRQRFWTSTFRINPRSLIKSEVWFGIILLPLTYLFGLLVMLAVWGVSVDILLARTKSFLTGFNIGEVHISLTSLFLGLVSFWIAMLLVKMLKNSIQNGGLSKLDFDDAMKNSILSGIGFFGFIFSVVLGIAVAGGSFKSLALMAGALSFGAGLGLQNIVSNLVAGITILFERPIKLGDWVIINGYEGIVKRISMRSTTLEVWNKSDVIIPNSSIISGSVVNKTLDNRMGRIEIPVGVDYSSDISLVKETLLSIANNDEDILKMPAPSLAFKDFADSSLNFQLNCYTANVFNSSTISFRIRENIINEFRAKGINIPYPQRVVRSLEEAAGGD